MALRPQYFVPFMLPDNRVLGAGAISLTTFNGNETTVTIGSVVYPARKISYYPVTKRNSMHGQLMEFMAVDVSFTEWRRTWQDNPLNLENTIIRPRWYDAQGIEYKWEVEGDIDYWLNGDAKTAMGTFTPPSAPSGSNVSRNWSANSPFTNATTCQFFDIPWEYLSGITNAQNIAEVTIGTPSADPGSGAALKAMLVRPANMAPAGGYYTDVRIMRVSRNVDVPAGTYTWPLSGRDLYGQTFSINVSVVVANP